MQKGSPRPPLRPHQLTHPGELRSGRTNSKTAATSTAVFRRFRRRPTVSVLADHPIVSVVSTRFLPTFCPSLPCPVAVAMVICSASVPRHRSAIAVFIVAGDHTLSHRRFRVTAVWYDHSRTISPSRASGSVAADLAVDQHRARARHFFPPFNPASGSCLLLWLLSWPWAPPASSSGSGNPGCT